MPPGGKSVLMLDTRSRSFMKRYLTPLLVLSVAIVLVTAVLLLSFQDSPARAHEPHRRADAVVTREPIEPLPLDVQVPIHKAALGERLFHDPTLSADRTVSCATCHPLDKAGADRLRVSQGIGGRQGKRNAPTVFNAAFNFAQFWDARVATLEDQVSGPLTNPDEMGSNWTEVVARLSADAAYRAEFTRLYTDGITPGNVADAIAAFERTLITPNSRFDRYLRGEQDALNAVEMRGYARFKELGCASCHQGVNIGGNLVQRFGVMDPAMKYAPAPARADRGRFDITGREEDRYVFKVPSLRNVAVTPPYFHGGGVNDLGEAVAIMGRSQLGRELSDEDRTLIVAFLRSLTGRYAGKSLE